MFFSVNVSNFTQNRCFFPIKAVLEDRGPAMLVIPKQGVLYHVCTELPELSLFRFFLIQYRPKTSS